MRAAGCGIGAGGANIFFIPLYHFTGFFASKSSLKSIFIPYFDQEGDLRSGDLQFSSATFPKQALNPCSSKSNGGRWKHAVLRSWLRSHVHNTPLQSQQFFFLLYAHARL